MVNPRLGPHYGRNALLRRRIEPLGPIGRPFLRRGDAENIGLDHPEHTHRRPRRAPRPAACARKIVRASPRMPSIAPRCCSPIRAGSSPAARADGARAVSSAPRDILPAEGTGVDIDLSPLLILIAGPYRSGTGDDPAKMAANVATMEAFALPLFRAGHLPVVGEWLALPLVGLAGSARVGDEAFDEVFHPVAERLLARCDGVLRVGGPSAGADEMVRIAREKGLRVFTRLREVPGCGDASEPTL
jgi:hypothetical protein